MRKIWIDTTGVMRWGAQPPTGIQRVEQTICKAAFNRDNVDFVALDGTAGRYRQLSKRDRSFLEYILSGQWPTESDGYWTRLRGAFRFLDVQFNYQDNETSRRLAQAVIGYRPRRGIAFGTAKTGIRILQWTYLAGRVLSGYLLRSGARLTGRQANPSWRGSIVLVSHEVNRHRLLDPALQKSGLRPVHIVHDLIPVLQPELTAPRFSARMEGFFRRVLTRPEPVISVSHATKSELQMWNQEVVKAPYPFEIKVCPLGSALVSTDLDDDVVPFLSNRSFALYCSTFEKRKNQLFLVSVWAWLARNLDAGLLPDLVLVGRRGNIIGQVEAEIAAASELSGRVHILSGISDKQLRWLYRHAVLGLFPSSAEGWGLGVSECMAYGLPTVHSDIPALREAAQDLMPALPVLDFDAWTECVRDILATPARLDALRQIVTERYNKGSPDGFGGGVLDHLKQLADEMDTASDFPADGGSGPSRAAATAQWSIATSPSSLT